MPNLIEELVEEYFGKSLPQIREEGRQEGSSNLILHQLRRRIDAVSDEQQEQIKTLSVGQLERLSEDLFNFNSNDDLAEWLRKAAN